jgi:enoyl-CoA hydratase
MDTVKLETLEPGIKLLTLNRPEAMNSLSLQLLADLHQTLDQLKVDRQCRVLLITGAGKGFCSGADLANEPGPRVPGTEQMGQLGHVYKIQEYIADIILKIRELPQPVLALVNGAAVGGGLAIALACDLRFAAASARFGSVFIKVGLSSCDVGVSYLLPRLVGHERAAELMLTGRVIDAAEAAEIGLVLSVSEPQAMQEAALATARKIVANNEYGVWMTKKGLNSAADAPSLRHAMEMENRTQVLGYFSGNMEEAMQAFMEGRKPDWKPL